MLDPQLHEPLVSVVIPVFEPGPAIESCIESLLGQSLAASQLEIIFVDDGSRDETPARLDALASGHAHIRVLHEANSGWAGRPRNVGIDAARGRYLFFLDQDDRLTSHALERLVALAEDTGAEVAVGKMAGFHRIVPRELFEADRPRATIRTDPLIDSLTPHKLFRRDFVVRHGLRFPEGRRRLEDHPFVLRAYFLANHVSVLSSVLCYRHVRLHDSSNAGLRRIDPTGYYRDLRDALDVIEAHTTPGADREGLLPRHVRAEMLRRLADRAFVDEDDAYRETMVREVRTLLAERIDPSVDLRMEAVERAQLAAVRAGATDAVHALAVAIRAIKGQVRVSGVRAGGRGLALRVEARLPLGSAGFLLEEGRLRLAPGVPASGGPAQVPVRGAVGTARIVLRNRHDHEEVVGPTVPLASAADGPRVEGVLRAPLATISAGAPLRLGTWDVFVRLTALGLSRDVRVGQQGSPDLPARFPAASIDARPARVARPYWSSHRQLSLKVIERSPAPWYRRLLRSFSKRLTPRR